MMRASDSQWPNADSPITLRDDCNREEADSNKAQQIRLYPHLIITIKYFMTFIPISITYVPYFYVCLD